MFNGFFLPYKFNFHSFAVPTKQTQVSIVFPVYVSRTHSQHGQYFTCPLLPLHFTTRQSCLFFSIGATSSSSSMSSFDWESQDLEVTYFSPQLLYKKDHKLCSTNLPSCSQFVCDLSSWYIKDMWSETLKLVTDLIFTKHYIAAWSKTLFL
jgi:hypothetical protein